MTRRRPFTFIASAAVLPLSALAIAACGGGGGAATAAAPLPSSHGHVATVGVGHTGLGTVLIDSKGDTLYLFKADSGTKSTCSGSCAAAWPPLLAKGKPTAGKGARASLLGTTRRADGATQVTYNGHPVYMFVKDHKPGQTTGQGVTAFGAPWFALTPSGNQVTAKPSSSGGGSGGIY